MRSVKHYHKHGKLFCWWCITNTLAFPIEHFVWEKLPVFASVTRLLGL